MEDIYERINEAIYQVDRLKNTLNKTPYGNVYQDILKEIESIKRRMQDTHRHNVQQLYSVARYITDSEPGSNEYNWGVQRQTFLRNEIETYRIWARRNY